MSRTLPGLCVLAFALAGCATRTPVSGKFPPITPRAAQGGQYAGATVRWGGVLVDTTPEAGRTCFRVMGLPLDGNGRPQGGTGETQIGRFIACAQGFYDPVLYAAGRRITFVGTITGVKKEAVGGYQYPYPELDARIVYLWPKEAPAPTSVYYGPYYWGPWGPWGADWWWSPWGYWPPAYEHGRDHDDRRRKHPPPPSPAPGGRRPAPIRSRPLPPGMKLQPRPPSRPVAAPAHPAAPRPAPPSAVPPPARPAAPPPARPLPPARPSSPPPSRAPSHVHPPSPRTYLRAATYGRRAQA